MKKTIILESLLAAFLMLMIPNVNAIDYHQITDTFAENIKRVNGQMDSIIKFDTELVLTTIQILVLLIVFLICCLFYPFGLIPAFIFGFTFFSSKTASFIQHFIDGIICAITWPCLVAFYLYLSYLYIKN